MENKPKYYYLIKYECKGGTGAMEFFSSLKIKTKSDLSYVKEHIVEESPELKNVVLSSVQRFLNK